MRVSKLQRNGRLIVQVGDARVEIEALGSRGNVISLGVIAPESVKIEDKEPRGSNKTQKQMKWLVGGRRCKKVQNLPDGMVEVQFEDGTRETVTATLVGFHGI